MKIIERFYHFSLCFCLQIESSDEIVHSEDVDNNHKLKDDRDGVDFSQQILSSERANHYSITTSKEVLTSMAFKCCFIPCFEECSSLFF